MLVDITHCTPPARSRVYQLATHHNATSQIIATHMGAKAINPDTYCLEDWEIKWLADNGGVVGHPPVDHYRQEGRRQRRY